VTVHEPAPKAAEKGQWGERMAAKYYLQRGCRLLAHNYRTRFGELDLVLISPERVLIICEVKLRAQGAPVSGAEAVHAAKQRRLILAAQHYVQHTGFGEATIRFDVAEVTPMGDGRAMVHLIENAFVCEEETKGRGGA
jgi:putative endonuclease